jgi:hypothetical protein
VLSNFLRSFLSGAPKVRWSSVTGHPDTLPLRHCMQLNALECELSWWYLNVNSQISSLIPKIFNKNLIFLKIKFKNFFHDLACSINWVIDLARSWECTSGCSLPERQWNASDGSLKNLEILTVYDLSLCVCC